MDVFSKRPLFLSCMVFLGCSVLGFFIPGIAKMIVTLLAVVTLVFSIILAIVNRKSSKGKYAILCSVMISLMVALSLASSYVTFDLALSKREATYGNQYTVDACVVEVRSQNNFSSAYKVEVENLNGKSDNHSAVLECTFSAALQPGDKVSIIATANSPEAEESRYNEAVELYSEGIYVVYSSSNESSLKVHEYASYSDEKFTFKGINRHLSSILTRKIGGEEGNLASALLLGNKYLLGDSAVRDFRRAGASHILALSGMHMSIIMGAAMLLLKRITQKRWLISIILSLFALFYLALTGFSVSATRSVIMLLIVYLSILVSALPDSLTSLSVAGFLIILCSPGAVLDAAFWMSFAATLGILVFIPPINNYFSEKLAKYDNKLKKLIRKILYSIITALATGIAALVPLIAVLCIFIKEISVFSILSSVVLSIPTAIMIIGSLLLLPFAEVPFISDLIVTVLRAAGGFMMSFCEDVSVLEDAVYSLNYPFATVMAILLGAAILYSLISKHRNPFTSLLPFAVTLCLCIGAITAYEIVNKDNVKVSYINASSNSDMIVVSNEREGVILDVSNGSNTSYYKALDELYSARVTEIRAIMLTRYTNQHTASLLKVFESNRVRELWLPVPTNNSDLYKLERLYAYARKNGVEVYLYDQGERLSAFESVTIEHSYDYISRSTVPVSLIGVYTASEHFTYASPAFNESELNGLAQYHFSKSHYVVFGNRGPRTKTPYSIENIDKVKAVAFADDIRIAYYTPPQYTFASYYKVSEEIEFYLDK